MRKAFIVATTALIVAGLSGWVATSTRARVVTPISVQIDPFQMTVNSKNLPTQHYDDYSLVF